MKGRWFSKLWDGYGIFFKVFIVCPTNLLAYYNETPKILFTSHHNPESSILSVIKDSVTFDLHFKFTSSTSSSSIFFLRTSDYIINLLRLDSRKSSSNCSCLSPQKQEATQESIFSVIKMLSYIIVVIIYLFIHYYCYHFNKAFSFS